MSSKDGVYKLSFLFLIFLLFASTAESAEQWNLGLPNSFSSVNVTTVFNLTYLSQNSVPFVGAGGQITSDSANYSYYTSNGTLVLQKGILQALNVTTVANLTYLSQNSIPFIGAGGQVTQDAVNFSYFTANGTLVVKKIQATAFNDTDNTAYYIDPASGGYSAILAGSVGIGTLTPAGKLDVIRNDDVGDSASIEVTRGKSVSAASFQYGVRVNLANTDSPSGIAFGSTMNYSLGSTQYVLRAAKSSDGVQIVGIKGDGNITTIGNIGIGTTAPGAKLGVKVGTDQDLSITTTNGLLNVQSVNDVWDTFKPMSIDGSTVIINKNTAGNVGIGTASFPSGGGTPGEFYSNAVNNPTGMPANVAGWFSKAGEMYGIDSGGTVTGPLTPHPDEFLAALPNDVNHTFPWVFSEENPYLGKKLAVDMELLARLVEKANPGTKIIYEESVPKASWAELENWRESEENNKSRNEKAEAWVRNNSEIEIPASQVFETITDTKTVVTGKVIGSMTEYVLDETTETITPVQVPIYETKTVSQTKKKMKDSVRFDRKTGKFYQKRTKEEGLAAVGENYPHYTKQAPPKWMQDRGAS